MKNYSDSANLIAQAASNSGGQNVNILRTPDQPDKSYEQSREQAPTERELDEYATWY